MHLHYFIVGTRRVALEEGVRLAGRPDAADDARTGGALFRHLIYGVDVVLQVGVDADADGPEFPCAHEPFSECRLVAAVAVKAKSGKTLVIFVRLFDDLPGAVGGTVVNKKYPAVGRGIAHLHELREALAEPFNRFRQDFFLIVAGYYDEISFHFDLQHAKVTPTL